MVKKNKMKNNFFMNKLLLACFLIMLAFSVFNIGKVLANVDNIVLTNAVIKDKSSTTDATIKSFNNDKLVTEITYHKVNDYVTFKLTFKNNDSKKYTIKTITDSNTDSRIVYEYDKHENEEFTSKSEKDIVIKSTYKNENTNMNKRDVNDDVEFKITFVDEDGNESEKVIPINPQTSDDLLNYISIGILALVGLLITLKHKMLSKSLLVLMLMVPFVTKAASLSYDFKFITEVKYSDKMLVTIDRNGTKEEVIVPYSEKMEIPEVINIPGYNFIGFYDGDTEFDFNSSITEDTNITAKYEIITYNISYDLADGTVSSANPLTYTVEDEFTLNNPTKQGFEFAGWTGTGLSGLTTSVKVNKGTTESLSFTAHFVEGTSTPYKVIHKYQNYDLTTYTEEEQPLTGVTNSTVYPQIRHKTGFVDPEVTGVFIKPDGTARLEYEYLRDSFSYSFNEDVNSSLVAGSYLYETEITVTPKAKAGYTFSKWEDNSTNNPRTIVLSANTNVVPTYTANDDTPYKVKHYKQKLDGTYPSVPDEIDDLTCTTDTNVTPDTKSYTGFTAPSTETKKILGDESTVFEYYYTRDKHNLTVTNYNDVVEGNISDEYYYGQSITLTAKEKTGHTFSKWSNDETENPITIIMGTSDIEIGPEYTINTYTFAINNATVSSTLPAGTYDYGTEITITAEEVPGYTFSKWEDNSTTNPRTITLTGNTVVQATYTANDDTPYKVKHYKQKLDGTYPSVPDEIDDLTGTTDTNVTPDTKSYTGFTAPSTETKKILGDESTVFEYYYTRDKHNLTVTNYNDVVEGNISNEYYYGQSITLTAKEKTGYTFSKWSNDETENPITITMGTSDIEIGPEYTINTYTFAINKSEYVESTLPAGTYDYGTEITVTAKTIEGYAFSEWEDGTPTASKIVVITDNITVEPFYVARNDTAYTVKHYKQQLDGTYSETPDETDDLTGTTDASVTPDTKSYTGFTSPSTQSKQIAADGSTVFKYYYTRDKHELILENYEDILEGDISDEYYYGQSITLTAKEKEGYTFSKWSNDETENPITITMGTSDITIGPEYTINSYTITFDTQGGSPVPAARVIAYNQPIGELNDVVEKEGYTFAGWYDDPDGGTLITEETLVTKNDIYYAHWDEIIASIICKKAVSLNTEICNASKNGQGCRGTGTGYNVGDTITYGNIIRTDNYAPGDAFDCNVDGTGYNKRFYYLRTIDNKAVLIYNESVAESIYGKDDPASYLPTASTWSNLPISFDNNGVTRFPSTEDLCIATGLPDVSAISANYVFDSINFIFENTGYAISTGKSTVWVTTNGELTGRYHKNNRNYNVPDAGINDSYNSVRPVIEIPLVSIQDDYIVKFDAMDGTLANEYVRVVKGETLSTLPIPTKNDWEFLGWYDSNEFTNQITTSHIPIGYETYYAKYIRSIGSSELTYDSFELEENDTDTITFVDDTDLEPRTYISSNNDVVMVDANGNISATGTGTATITITGEVTNTTKIVTVTVVAGSPYYHIIFDVDGGEEVSEQDVIKNTAIGSLPTTTKTNYTFGGWFTDTYFTTEVTAETIITKNMTVHAKWIPDDAVAEVNNNTFYTTLQGAIDGAPTTKSTIKLLKNVEVTTPIDMSTKNTNKDIVLDLNGYTLSTADSAAAKTNVIKTKGKLEVKNGTISSAKNDALIDTEGSTAYLVLIEDINMIQTGGRACVYNNGGNVLIDGNASLTSNAEWASSQKRGTVQTLASGTTIIKGGTIINNRSSNSYAVSNIAGTVTIGTKDDIYDTQNLIMQGETSGIYTDINFSLYDGLVKGKTSAVTDESKITSIEDNATKVNDEVDGYKRLYYTISSAKYKVTIESNGGTGAPDFVTVDAGDPVTASDVTTPTRGVYTFDGWYYDDGTFQNSVTFPFTPTGNVTIYANWSYTPNPTPVSFNMTSDAIEDYYTNINTWKTQINVSGSKASQDDPSDYMEVLNTTQFDASMRANFDAHGCSSCGPDSNIAAQNNCSSPQQGEYCERPKGYSTGLTDSVNVYEYNTSTQVSTLVTYTTVENGIIYNMIPGKTYKWESASDSNVYGFVAATATSGRRTIYSSVRNVRDLGGMSVSFTRDNTTKTGTLKYGKLFRGTQLAGGQTDVNSITKLGVTREVDLRDQNEGTNPFRLPKHDKCDGNCGTLTSTQDIIITNYLIYPNYNNGDNYDALRDALKYVMQSVVDGDNIYFHCTIGTDRTGTLAYFLEGLLGVSEEERLEDYELTYFYGLLNRTRYHDILSGSSIKPRFLSMYKTYDTNAKIYNWYMYGLTAEQIAEENVLIEQFRDAMIDYSN